jgi:hypothetical protein
MLTVKQLRSISSEFIDDSSKIQGETKFMEQMASIQNCKLSCLTGVPYFMRLAVEPESVK